MNMILEQDKQGIETLIEQETLCWGEVTRLARDADEQDYMLIEMPRRQQPAIKGGERCIIYLQEADADNASPRMLYLMGRRVPFVVLAIDEENNQLICSRKKAQNLIKLAMRQSLIDGSIYEGELTGFSRYGGYIEVNGVTGHIRNSDLTDDHSDIREYFSIGDHLDVKCKELTPEGYIFWEVVSKLHRTKPVEHDFEEDTVVLGRVSRISNFKNGIGVFVNLKTGIDALCSMPREVEIQEGSRVSLKIETITPGQRPTDAPRIRGRILRTI